MDDFGDKVLGHVARPDYQPVTVKAMAKRLEIGPDLYGEFRRAVKGLVREGRLEVGKDKTLRKPAEAKAGSGLIVGTFRRTSKGFGFVRPKGSPGDRENDVYIPADEAGDASTGDEVAVKLVRRSHKKGYNREGKIVRVVARASGVFVGTYFEEDGQGLVKVDGTTFRDPIQVGDPGAKGAKPGDKVAVEMVRYPTPLRAGEAVLTEVLGPKGQPGVDTLTVIRAFGIPDKFDDAVLIEAREQARDFDEEQLAGRRDLRDVLTVTIDPATARDFDDAISLSRDDRGYWNLGVHIADVSHFVRVGSLLDKEARKRGTSVYLPDRVIPMLPEVLSNSLASLQEGRTRFTMSALMQFDAEGRRTDVEFARSAIRVDRRFSYEQAFEVMKNPEDHKIEGVTPEVRDLLVKMLELAMILRKRRFARGALELVMPEVEVELDDNGQVVGAHLAPDDESHQVIEEFMLAANEAVAESLTARQVGFLRRAHADPEPGKLRQFAEFAGSLGYPIEQYQSRFELQRVLKASDDKPERHAVHYGLLRSLKQASYTPEPQGHYALASEDYCHFTSPIRRYPDLQVHRQLGAILAGKKPKSDLDELAVLGEHCTRTERRAELAERELIKIKLLTHLEGRIGEGFHAIIVRVEDFGLFCQLVELPIDGLLHITTLADDFYYLEDGTHTLVGRQSGRRYRLGDRLDVVVARVDVDRRELDLIPGDHPEAHLPPSRTRPRTSAPRAPKVRPFPSPADGDRKSGRGKKVKGKKGKRK
jgi:ribonuclease R